MISIFSTLFLLFSFLLSSLLYSHVHSCVAPPANHSSITLPPDCSPHRRWVKYEYYVTFPRSKSCTKSKPRKSAWQGKAVGLKVRLLERLLAWRQRHSFLFVECNLCRPHFHTHTYTCQCR